MKKIAIDLCKLSNLNCGLGQIALNFGENLSKENSEFELHYIVPKEFIGYFDNSNIIYHTKSGIKRYLTLHKFDLWHSIHQEPKIIPKDDTPILLTIHDLNFLDEKSKRKSKKRLKKLQKLVDKCQEFVFISNFSKAVAEDKLNFNRNPRSVIYNGVNIINEETAFENINSKFFFSMGVFKKKKNFEVLIPVMKYFPNYKLIIAGDTKGKYIKELISMAKRENVWHQILFPGIITEKEKTWLYRNCEAFLFPSLCEGFGLPVVEAMRNGAPVITSDKTSLPEIGGGHSFILESFDPTMMAQKIKESIHIFNENKQLKIEQIKYAESFNWERNTKYYLKMYDTIITKK
jgi:glycosyltransferase involved in cell wall biosynthesis